LGRLVELAPAPASALGSLHDLLFPGVMGDAVLDAWHDRSSGLEQTVDTRVVGGAHEVELLEPILPLPRLLGQDVRVVGVPTLELPGSGPEESLHRGALGLLLRHLDSLWSSTERAEKAERTEGSSLPSISAHTDHSVFRLLRPLRLLRLLYFGAIT